MAPSLSRASHYCDDDEAADPERRRPLFHHEASRLKKARTTGDGLCSLRYALGQSVAFVGAIAR
jgi:hypothetical protein